MKKGVAALLALIMVISVCGSAFAADFGIRPLNLTFDANVEVNGEITVMAKHYGNFAYNARYFIQNYSDVTVSYRICNPSGYLLASGNVLPHGHVTNKLLQSIFKWNLYDGKYTVHFATPDGSKAQIYFKYRVLD